MALELILKLLDKLTDLLKRQQENDRAFFNDFVEPVFQDFEKLHQAYLDSFTKYRELLGKPNGSAEDLAVQLLQSIRRDTIQIDRQVAKLAELASALDGDATTNFCESLICYLQHKSVIPSLPLILDGPSFRNTSCPFIGQRALEVKDWSISTSRNSITQDVDVIVKNLQLNYQSTVREYMTLKRQLLRPR